jgi:hypothetical protein
MSVNLTAPSRDVWRGITSNGIFDSLQTKANFMKLPTETKPALWGAAGGAVALAIVGFTWGGWVTAGAAERDAHAGAEAAVVAVLAPICVEQFQHAPDSKGQLVQFINTGKWERRDFVKDRGWATMPGSKTDISGVAGACADLLGKLKSS